MNKQELEAQFAKLYAHMDRRFDSLDAKIDDEASVLRDEMRTGFDQIAARLDDDDTERLAMTAQLDRHEHWHRQEAEALGLTLQHDA